MNNADHGSSQTPENGARETKANRESLAYSISRITQDSIVPSEAVTTAPKGEKRRDRLVRVLFLAVCVSVFIYGAYSAVKTLVGYRDAENFYNAMLETVDAYEDISTYDPPLSPFGKQRTYEPEQADKALFERMKTRITRLGEVNDEIIGWINIPGTAHINYPILHRENDTEFYLDHAYTGDYMTAGSIFLSGECDEDFNANYNTVIYGHNMQNGLMFSELIRYLDEQFFRDNEYIYVYNKFGAYTYRVFAVYKANYKYQYIRTGFADGAEFLAFANEMRGNSIFTRDGVEFKEDSRILTLSTCTNAVWSDRYAVQAVLVKWYNSPEAYD